MMTPNKTTRTSSAHRARRIAWATVSLVALFGIGATRRHATAESAVSATLDDSTPRIQVDLDDRKLRLSLGDSAVESFTVAVGRYSMPTPRGTFRIRKIVWNPAWIPPDREWARDKVAQDPGAKNNPM